jgi:hypothetical protein
MRTTSAQDRHHQSFRHDLRVQTSEHHNNLEALFAPFMDDPETHMRWFISASYAGFLALALSRPAAPMLSRDVLDEMLRLLRNDLQRFGGICVPLHHRAQLGADALDYIILGSRLGNEVIRRHVSAKAPYMKMPAYLEQNSDSSLWKILCARLDAVGDDEVARHSIVKDAKQGFVLMYCAARLQRTELSPRGATL